MHEAKQRNYSTPFWLVIVILVALGAYNLGLRQSQIGPPGVVQDSTPEPTVKLRGIGSQPPKGALKTVNFQQFWDLWDVLNEKFYQTPLDEEKLLYGAMSGLTQATGDPYTVFFEPEIAAEFSQSLEGKFEGIGAEIGIKDKQLKIIAPLSDTPASRAGLLPGDSIFMINSTSTEGMSVERAVLLIRGKKGTTVNLTIGRIKLSKDTTGKETREAVELEIPIIRDTIIVPSVKTDYLEDGLVVLKISHFNSDTAQAFSAAVDEALSRDVRGIILDLRNNPGGFLDLATAVAGEWVGEDLVVIERRRGVKVDEFHGTGQGRLRDLPTIVLINEGSASASEIVAGALQDYGLAQIVGMKSFGKGSVQDLIELADNTAIKITVAEWLTPKERFINDVGIEPDIVIEMTDEDYAQERDPQLDKAREIIKSGIDGR